MRSPASDEAARDHNEPAPVREGEHGFLWYPVGAALLVSGMRIGGGLLYVKDAVASSEGAYGVIESDVLVGYPKRPVFQPASPANRPVSYGGMGTAGRARYLQWLAQGRDDPEAEPAFVLNHFCGLERRVFWLLENEEPLSELLSISTEVRRLRGRYPAHEHLMLKSRELLRLLDRAVSDTGQRRGFSGDPLPGQGTYLALHRDGARVHYDAPVGSDTAESDPVPDPASEVVVSSEIVDMDTPERRDEHAESEATFLNRELLARIQEDNAASDRLLDDLFEELDQPEEQPVVAIAAVTAQATEEREESATAEAPETEQTSLSTPLLRLVSRLAERDGWSRSEAADQARDLGLMIDAALTQINGFAEEQCEAEVVYEEDGRLLVDTEIFEELGFSAVKAPAAPEPAAARSKPAGESTPPPENEAARVGPPRWISGVETVRVGRHPIGGGMFYYGVPGDTENRPEAIDPSLPVEIIPGGGPSPSPGAVYADLSPEDRGRFLDWLREGRSPSTAEERFLTLLLHGLEYRALVELDPHGEYRDELAELLAYVRSLVSLYPAHQDFVRSATLFAAALERLAMSEADVFSVRDAASRRKMSQQVLQLKLGMYAAAGRPVPFELVLLWVRRHPLTARYPQTQWTERFHQSFRKHFSATLPKGLRLPRELPRLTWPYEPAHPRLGVFSLPTGSARKAWDHFPTLQTLGMISRNALRDCAPGEAPPPEPDPIRNVSRPPAKGTQQHTTLAPLVAKPKFVEPDKNQETALREVTSSATKATTDEPPSTSPPAGARWSTWKAPGTEVHIWTTGFSGGMVYTGLGPGEDNEVFDLQTASSIDLRLAALRPAGERVGKVPDTVRGYPDLTPEQRGHYLQWIQDRRRTAGVPRVFPRLFIQGMERRIVSLVQQSTSRVFPSYPLLKELESLRSGFAEAPEVASYADDLLGLIGAARPILLQDPPRYASGDEKTPFSLLRGLGEMARSRKALPLAWAVEWVVHHLRPDDPKALRERVALDLVKVRLPQRLDLVVPKGLPDLVFTHRPRCTGLEEVDVVLDGVPDLSGVEPPRELLEHVSARILAPVQLDRGVASTTRTDPVVRSNDEGTRSPGEDKAHPWVVDWVRLAIEMSRHSGEMTARHRVSIARGAQELGDVSLILVRRWKLRELEDDGSDPQTRTRTLVDLPLRRRERAGDLLVDLLDLSASATSEQSAFLLAIHQRLGLDAVLRMRLSYRGVALDPAGNSAMDSAGKPRVSTRHRVIESIEIDGLSSFQAGLLADLGQAHTWSALDTERLAAWYGMEPYSALHTLNTAARKLIGTDVFAWRGDVVAVDVERVKEMTA